jgi:hypothetical protein
VSTKTMRMVVTCVALGGALIGMRFNTLVECTEFYMMHVDEVLKDPDAWQDLFSVDPMDVMAKCRSKYSPPAIRSR